MNSINASRTVLVTGAASGIGKVCALRLAEEGFRVIAGVRNDHASAELKTSAGVAIETIRLDITDAASIAAAAKHVVGQGLFGLVNNAGNALLGPTEFLSIERIRAQFEVNVFGHIALTKAMLPALRASCGRIVNMSSISGRVAFPFAGPYAASKFALEAFSDALRRELRPSGVRVVLVQPGNMKTEIWARSFQIARAAAAEYPPEAWTIYGERLARSQRGTEGMGDPAEVGTVVLKAMLAARPRARYLVGRDARMYALLSRLPDWLVDRFV